MQAKFLKVTLNLFDGGEGTASAGSMGASENGDTTNTEKSIGTVRKEVLQKGRSIGLSDDLLEDYQKAFDSKQNTQKAAAENKNSSENEGTQTESTQTNDNEFESLIKGKFKDEYDKRVKSLVKDRLSTRDKEIAQLKTRSESADKILTVLANKYPEIDGSNLDALLEAVKQDNDMFQQKALDDGITAEEARKQFNEQQKQKSIEDELNQLKREKATSQLDARLQRIAQETKKMYPDFDLQSEFTNPKFCSALDFIAQRNEAKNKESGKNDEIFDLTYAYELAHADEIRNNTIKKVSKATMSAVAQNIAANGNRPKENANSHSAPAKPKGVDEMSDTEFDDLLYKIKNGTGHIPRG